MIKFTIGVEPKTKKNSQQVVMIKGRPRIIQGKAYRDYEKAALPFCPDLHIDYPVNIKATYYRRKHHRVDITNLESALMDILVKAGTLKDDSVSIVVSTDGSRVKYDPENPRTEIEITEANEIKTTETTETTERLN